MKSLSVTPVRRPASLSPALEALEARTLLAAVSLEAIGNQTIPAGKTLHVPLNATDSDGQTVTYTVETDNAGASGFVYSGNPHLRLSVAGFGDMTFELFQNLAPKTVEAITGLVKAGFYDGLTFHRVISDFMVQGGDPQGDGSGGPNFQFDDEFTSKAIFSGTGQLAMANSGKDTNGSQFFITVSSPRFLDFNHTIFGQLVEGQAVLDAIKAVAVDSNDKPNTPVVISQASLVNNNQDGVLRLTAASGTGTTTVTVTARSSDGTTAARSFTLTRQTDTTDDPPVLGEVSDKVVGAGETANVFLSSSDMEGDAVTYDAAVIEGFHSNGTELTETELQDFAVSRSGNKISVSPPSAFQGRVTLLVGVKQTDATGRGSTSDPYDKQEIIVGFGDAAISAGARRIEAVAGAIVKDAVVATFTDDDPAGKASDFTAEINWGDNTVSDGAITKAGNGVYYVTASNVYPTALTFPMSVRIIGNKGATATVTMTNTTRDLARFSGAMMVLHGTSGNDVMSITSVAGDKTRVNLNGLVKDYANSAFSNISLAVFDGNDSVSVGAGVVRSKLVGGNGNDSLFGGDNGDTLDGSAGNDVLEGNAGNDLVSGAAGSDTLRGGDGNDSLYGIDGADRILGGAGNDFLKGGTGADKLYGEAGIDILWGESDADLIDGGADFDSAKWEKIDTRSGIEKLT